MDGAEIRQVLLFRFKILHWLLYVMKFLPGAAVSSISSLQAPLKQSAVMAVLKLLGTVAGNKRMAQENHSHFLWYQFCSSELASFHPHRVCICPADKSSYSLGVHQIQDFILSMLLVSCSLWNTTAQHVNTHIHFFLWAARCCFAIQAGAVYPYRKCSGLRE